MPDSTDTSWNDKSVVVVTKADSPSAGNAYTLANALEPLVGHVLLIAFGHSPESYNIEYKGSLPVIYLDNLPDTIDWPVDVVINTVTDHASVAGFCRQLKERQGSYWIERHDAQPEANADDYWRLTAGQGSSVALAQPRWTSWQTLPAMRQFFEQKLQDLLSNTPVVYSATQAEELPELEASPHGETNVFDVVMFWKQNDSGLYGRRSDQVANYLASRDDIRQVLLIDAPIKRQELLAHRSAQPGDQGAHVYYGTVLKAFRQADSDGIKRRVFYFDPRYKNYHDYHAFLQAQFVANDINVSKSLFWMYPKLAWGEKLVSDFSPAKRVMDVVDDHRAWPNITVEKKQQLTKHYQSLLSSADKVITNCLPVKLSMYEFNHDIAMVPNGCEQHPAVIKPERSEHYQRIVEHAGPVLGFIGNLESKIDIELLQQLARSLPKALIVLVGSTHANADVRQLQSESNVLMTGVIPYRYIPAIVEQFDVGLVPHKYTELTENMNPLKVFVYLASNVPVVATSVPNIASFQYVWQTKTHSEFIERATALVSLDNESIDKESIDRKKFDEFKRHNSWAMRLAVVVDSLLSKQDVLPEKVSQ